MGHVQAGIRTYTPNRIDHIFVTPNFTVEKYGVLTDTYRTKNETTGKYESTRSAIAFSLGSPFSVILIFIPRSLSSLTYMKLSYCIPLSE